MNFTIGDKVIFSGSLFSSDEDSIKETSMTASGAMLNPEFHKKFNTIKQNN